MKPNVIFHDGYVKVEYQHDGRTRFSTGIPIPDKSYLTKSGQLKTTVKDYREKQVVVSAFEEKAMDIFNSYVQQYKIYPTCEQYKIEWRRYDEKVKTSEKLMVYYDKFLSVKESKFQLKSRSQKSIKDYRNIKYYLLDYETYTNKEILLIEINLDWMNKFVLFLESKRTDYDKSKKVGGKYYSKGGLCGKTIRKRTVLFLSFFRWLSNEDYFIFPKSLYKYLDNIDDTETVKAILNKEEVNQLYGYDFNDNKLNYIKDLFVFCCFTGLRWEDLSSLNKTDIIQDKILGTTIDKVAKKTKARCIIPLNSIAKGIMEKYKLDFNKYSNANFNKYLKVLLHLTGWFEDETVFSKEDGTMYKIWECISIHRGRDIFCTMLVKNRVPLNEIMKYTGHKTLASLNQYIDKKSQVLNYTNELMT
jgi:integrase